MGIDDGGDRVRRVVEAVHEFEAEGNEQRQAEQEIGQDRAGMDDIEVGNQLTGGPASTGQDDDSHNNVGNLTG